MPLVLLCGHPCSGKTKRAEEFIAYAQSISTDKNPVTVQLINFETLNLQRNAFYADVPSEKHGRAGIKAAVTRLLNPTRIVICDYNNSIKGYRYEMFCMAREQNTTHAVIFCNTELATAAEWNSKRDEKTAYNKSVFDDVSKRLEVPNEEKKWDQPLFIVKPSDPLPSKAIFDALNDPSKAPKPTAATVAPKAAESNYLFELDKTTQHIIKTIVAAQNDPSALPTDDIKITASPTDEKAAATATGAAAASVAPLRVNFGKKISVAELNRLRRAYLKLAAMRPPQSTAAIAGAFVAFLNTSGKETVKDL